MRGHLAGVSHERAVIGQYPWLGAMRTQSWVVISCRMTDIGIPSPVGDTARVLSGPELWQTPVPIQGVVNGYKDKSHIGTP
jgi:hypothetical protein